VFLSVDVEALAAVGQSFGARVNATTVSHNGKSSMDAAGYHNVMGLSVYQVASAHRQFLQAPIAACIEGTLRTERSNSRSDSTAATMAMSVSASL
jgi:hypothetical protein